jgi:hypothetical protein
MAAFHQAGPPENQPIFHSFPAANRFGLSRARKCLAHPENPDSSATDRCDPADFSGFDEKE